MRVFIVAEYSTVRAGLVALVREQAGWSVVGQSAPGAALPAGPREPSDVLLAELDGPRAVEALATSLTAVAPRVGLVALVAPGRDEARGRASVEARRVVAEMARLAEEHGLALGMLGRDATGEEIVGAVTAVGGGLVVLDRRLAGDVLAAPDRSLTPVDAADGTPVEPLTARELEVLQLLAQGLPNKIIAARLKISEHTAKFHVSAIMTKLGAGSRTDAVTRAARRGLLIL